MVTSCPLALARNAAAIPPKPAPMTTSFLFFFELVIPYFAIKISNAKKLLLKELYS